MTCGLVGEACLAAVFSPDLVLAPTGYACVVAMSLNCSLHSVIDPLDLSLGVRFLTIL